MAAPNIDDRSAADIVARAQSLANFYLTGVWEGHHDPADPAFQLLKIFGRLMEILFERLNRMPEKNFLAFLDMVGVEPSPGQPASVPVTFTVSAKAEGGGFVPAGTQVATTQTESANAQIFETRDAFYATPARLLGGVNLLPSADRYSLLAPLVLPPRPVDLQASAGTVILNDPAPGLADLPHTLYLGSATLFGRKEKLDVSLVFTVAAGDASVLSAGNLRWQRFSAQAKAWVDVVAVYLHSPGKVQVVLPAFGGSSQAFVAGREGSWVACHFDGTLPSGATMPSLAAVQGSLAPEGGALASKVPVDAAFHNIQVLDTSKPFSPFGERPRYGDALYLRSEKAFAPEVDTVTVDATLKPYTDARLEEIFATITAPTTVNTDILWQYGAEGGAWKPLTEFRHTLTCTPGSPPTFVRLVLRDGVTTVAEDGSLSRAEGTGHAKFTFSRPADMRPIKVAGQEGLWIRAVIKSEDPYGRDAFVASASPLAVVGPTWIPPVVETLELSFTYKSQLQTIPLVVTENNLRRLDHAAAGPVAYPFRPFAPPDEQAAGSVAAAFSGGYGLYLGFDRPFGEVYVSLYLRLQESFPSVETPAEGGGPIVAWEYLSSGSQWKPLEVTDGTRHLTRSGTVSFPGPDDAAVIHLFDAMEGALGGELCWLRVRLAQGFYQYPPVVHGIFPNTVLADHQATQRGALILGSGSGEKGQSLRLPRAPVLAGSLWVREPEVPSQGELARLQTNLSQATGPFAEGGSISTPSVVELSSGTSGTEREAWVRWQRVPNFLGSGPRDRHYTLNPLDGEIRLGDGTHGLMPPSAKDNLTFRDFQTGGGEIANRAGSLLAVKELKSSLPYVDKVFNVASATGGSNPWELADILRFGPQLIKNNGQAVTAEDFEWMVLQRFSQVARAKCLSTRAPGPSGLVFKPGAVTVVVLPKGTERLPRPGTALLDAIREYLTGRILGTIVADVHVLGPAFTEVAVKARLKTVDPRERSEVERRAARALQDFFHPLYGGEDGSGWAFGRDVFVSEVHAVLQRVQGVDYVAKVRLLAAPGAQSLDIGENHLVSSGVHELEMI